MFLVQFELCSSAIIYQTILKKKSNIVLKYTKPANIESDFAIFLV